MIFLVISVVFSLFSPAKQQPKGVTLSDLALQINENKISKIVVNGQDISVTMKDGTVEKTRKEDEAPLSETLKNLGAQLEKVQIETTSDSGLSYGHLN